MHDKNASAANYFDPHAQPALGIKIMPDPFSPGKPAEHSYRRTGDKEDTGFLSNTMGSLDELFSFCYCINCALWSQ